MILAFVKFFNCKNT